jgi:hypothetical protein
VLYIKKFLSKKKLLIVQEFQNSWNYYSLSTIQSEFPGIIGSNKVNSRQELQESPGITGIPGIPWNNCINWAENYD